MEPAIVTFTDPPSEKFGRLMSIPDDMILKYLELAAFAEPNEIQKAKEEQKEAAQWSRWQALLDAHLNPEPQVALGQRLAACRCVTAMQDISDGVATDLAHICEESGTGSILHAERLPFLPVLDDAVRFVGKEKMDLLLKGGEDYQLLFTVDPHRERELKERLPDELYRRLVPVGVITEGRCVLLEHQDGSRSDITFQGLSLIHISEPTRPY